MSYHFLLKGFRVHLERVRIIAIMLFRLRMTVDEAIVAYIRLSEEVFSKKTLFQKKRKVSQPENDIATVIHSSFNVRYSGQ